MDLLTLDYESYYADDYSLSFMTTEAYVRDPRFEVILVALKWNDAPAIWVLRDRFEHFIREEVDWANTCCVAHHAHFDGLILSHHFGIRPAMWLDTLSMARVVDGPKAGNSLYDLSKRHGLPPKGDYVVKAKNKHLADFSPGELRAYGDYSCGDCDNAYALVQRFLPEIPEQELRLIDLTIRMFTEPVLVGDQALLAQAVADEAERKQALLAQCGYDKADFSSNDKFAAILRQFGVEPAMKQSNTTGEPIFAFAKTDPAMQALLEHDDEAVRFLAETRLATKSTIVETRAQRLLDCSTRGPLPVYLKYGAAHTWRWGGGDKMNWQNFARLQNGVLKRAVMAPEGHSLVPMDSAQIEARIVALLAGQDDLVEAFRRGDDVYSQFAGEQIYMRPVDRRRNKEDYIPGQLGKVSVLGFGFGMGYLKFGGELLKGMLGAPPIQFRKSDLDTLQVDPSPFFNNPKKLMAVEQLVSRLELSDRLVHFCVADTIINRIRARYKKIPELWDTMKRVLLAMIAGQATHVGPVYSGFESIQLPGGMRLTYRDLQFADDEFTYWNGRERVRIHGPKATENVVQALARQVVAEQMLAIADLGAKVAVMEHDAVVPVVPDECAQDMLAAGLQIMSTPPVWWPELPLAAEGKIVKRYGDE